MEKLSAVITSIALFNAKPHLSKLKKTFSALVFVCEIENLLLQPLAS